MGVRKRETRRKRGWIRRREEEEEEGKEDHWVEENRLFTIFVEFLTFGFCFHFCNVDLHVDFLYFL